MTDKSLPFTLEQLNAFAAQAPTPFHVYDAAAIRANARAFRAAFAWVPGGFKNYFAVQALPNPHVLALLREEGMGGDCSSTAELCLCEATGIRGEDIVFTSNDTPASEYRRAHELGAIINLDDLSHVDLLAAALGGHTMVASNELNPQYFVETAQLLFDLVAELKARLGVVIEFVNLGGGIGIPYRPTQTAVDLGAVSAGIRAAYDQTITGAGLAPLRIVMECGRMVTGPYGYLVTRVLHKKAIYKNYVGLDACMANLKRPGMYGSYHHITVPAREGGPRKVYDVTGSLCENNDKFAIDREIADPQPGDLVVIHDTGAHGHAMGFNYNGKLRSAEYLWLGGTELQRIRRAETLADHFATLDYPGLPKGG